MGLLLLATLAFAGLLWRRRRVTALGLARVTALGLAVVLGIFAFALAIHSVHHLGMPEQVAECLVFTFSQHGAGTLAGTLDLGTPSSSDEGALLLPDDTAIVTLLYRPAQQRAPPADLT
jgi:disulfide bond formation protein DsbB